MLPSRPQSRERGSGTKYAAHNINYNLTEQSGSYLHKVFDLASNGYLLIEHNSASQKKTSHTEMSSIKCKKLNNKEVTLRTEPHHQCKKIQDAQEKYISARHKSKKAEQDSVGHSVHHTNRNIKKHQHLPTESFNNTGKFSHLTECKYRQCEDIAALQSKTTTRKSRKQSQPNNTQHEAEGHSRVPSFHLKSPHKSLEKVAKSKSCKKPQLVANKTTVVECLELRKEKASSKKIKPRKSTVRLEIDKIGRTVFEQIMELSNFSYGQYSKSEPDLHHRVVETEQVSFDSSDKHNAATIIKKRWQRFKKQQVQRMYSAIFSKNIKRQSGVQRDLEDKKSPKGVPPVKLHKLHSASKYISMYEQMNDDLEREFNVDKYVVVDSSRNSSQKAFKAEEEDVVKIKRRNRRLEKQLLRFKEKQLDLCEKFQTVLLASSSDSINAEELLQLIRMYKTEATMDKKSSTSSIVSYKELLEENGIAQKIASSKNPLVRSLLDNEGSLLRHKTSSKSISEEFSSAGEHKHPTFSPEARPEEQASTQTVETRSLLSTYLDCELGNIAYQKELSHEIRESIENEIEQFDSEEKGEAEKEQTRAVMLELARSEEFHEAVLNMVFVEFCEEIEQSPSMLQNVHYVREIETYNRTLQIRVSVPDIIEYLKGLMEHVMKDKVALKAVIENANRPLGSTSSELLYYLRSSLDESQSNYNENPYHFVIPMRVFEEHQSASRSLDASDSQEAALIRSFWHRSLYELLNELLDKKRPYGLRGKPYAWNADLLSNSEPIDLPRMTKIFESVLNEIMEILTFPTGLMFDSPLCQYYQCELSQEDQAKINQDRMWLTLCEEIVEDEQNYHGFEDEMAEVRLVIGDYIQDLLFFEAVVDCRKVERQMQRLV